MSRFESSEARRELVFLLGRLLLCDLRFEIYDLMF
jgi:hypothetical protein